MVMRKHGLRLFMPFLLAGVFFATTLSYAATAARITSAVVESERTTLKGNISPMARAEFDQGAVSDSQQMTHMRVMLSRTAAQETALKQLVADQMNPSSANYHKWLTPEQMGEEFGPSADDVATVESWLQAKGFTIEYVSPARTNIRFSGDAALVESAFQTSVHQFNTGTRSFYSNTTEPQIPSALATVVSGIAHMNSLTPRPHSHRGQAVQFSTEKNRFETESMSGVNPSMTSTGGYLYMVAADAATMYNTPNSYNLNFSGSNSYTGSGVKIAIAGDAQLTTLTPVTNYRARFLGDSTSPTVVTTGTLTSTSDADEAYMDLEISGALAPGASIYYYPSSDLFSGIETAINAGMDIISVSYGQCEREYDTSDNASIASLWQTAAVAGIAVTVSSGDTGSAGCDYFQDSSGNDVTYASYGFGVNAIASTPYNIAVGGTDTYALLSGFSTYVGSTNSSSNYYRTVKKYIPESTWNDSTVSNGALSANEDWTSYGTSSSANIVAGSGGISNCSTNSSSYVGTSVTLGTCESGYSKPSWQTGTGVSSSITTRELPDVSLMAGDGSDYGVWLVCTNDTASGVTYNCSSDSSLHAYGYGGTSAAAPAFAGILALVQQKTGASLGQAAKNLYELYNGSHGSSIFHDITQGNNSVHCAVSSYNTSDCKKNTAGYYFETGYDTTTGYDMATGLGSVDATALVTYWSTAASTGTSTPTVTVTPSPASISSAGSTSVTVAVTGSGSTPTGSVTLNYGSTADTESLTSGSYTFTVPGSALTSSTSGTSNTLTATYWGDSTYAGGSGSNTVTVTTSYYAVALSPASGSVSKGSSTTSTVTLSSSNNYSGTVTLTCAVTTTMTSYSSSYMPTCAFSQTSVTMTSGTASATPTLTISTTGSTSSRNTQPMLPGRTGIGGGVVLAVLLFCIPVRRKWRVMLGALLLMVGIGVVSGCNGGSGSSSSSGGTTSGTYTVTVTGTGNDSSTTKETATFTLTVK